MADTEKAIISDCRKEYTMKYIFIDFEMQELDREFKSERKICKQEIIEIGAIMLDESLTEISSFKRYVKPQYSKHISRKIIELTGITDNYLFGCKKLETEINAFAEWCLSFDDEIIVYAWSENDLSQINHEFFLKGISLNLDMQKVVENWRDLQVSYDAAVGARKPTSLTRALESLGIYFEGHMHDAVDDSRNTATIFRELSDPEEFQKSIAYIKDFVSDGNKSSGTTLGDLIDFSKLGICA